MDAQEVENEFALPFDTLKHRFTLISKVSLYDIQKAGNEFSLPFQYLKHHFHDFVQVAYFDALDSEIELTP
jgi:hypothetical protein